MNQEIRPKQLRALLLLLVLVPLIPTVLMLRFVVDAVDQGREVALERARALYQQHLVKSDDALEKTLNGRRKAFSAEELVTFYRSFIDLEAGIQIVDENGKTLANDLPPNGPLLAQISLRDHKIPWQVQIHLADPSNVNAAAREQIRGYALTAVIAVVTVFSIAVVAAIAVSQQLALHELKTTSVATVAHELRTPLASMRMLVDTLREGRYRGESQLQEYLDMVASENIRLSRLIDNFLTLSRLERNEHAISLVATKPRSIVEQAVSSMRAKLENPGCRFTLDIIEPLPEVIADKDSLAMVLMNLLDNAVKYTGDDKRITLHVWAASQRVFFSVVDNGLGLTRKERKNIFKRFYQVDQKLSRSRGGCGLGLALVHYIVQAHRGRIDIESTLGRGSTFNVSVPVATRPVPAESALAN